MLRKYLESLLFVMSIIVLILSIKQVIDGNLIWIVGIVGSIIYLIMDATKYRTGV